VKDGDGAILQLFKRLKLMGTQQTGSALRPGSEIKEIRRAKDGLQERLRCRSIVV